MAISSSVFDGRLISCQDLPPKATIFGQSEGMRGLWQIVERVASAKVPILILGERGTGKEVLARFIHSCSPGPAAPFLKVGLPNPDGHAIDGVALRVAPDGRNGTISDRAAGDPAGLACTLFVDEVAEVAPEGQLDVLRLIQGLDAFISSGATDIPATLRVIGASSRELERDVAVGKFREDLFSYLSVVTLRLPPLRERKDDIPQLVNHFWRNYSQRFGRQPDPPSQQLIDHLRQYEWPGNIRELENAMKRYVVLGPEGIADIDGPTRVKQEAVFTPSNHYPVSLKEATREAAHALERKIILRTLQETQWNRRRTARALNISYRSLLYKIKEGGLLSEQSKAVVENSGRRNPKPNHEVA